MDENNNNSNSQKKTFRIGICMAGAVSAGAYTAGVIDYLLEALEEWQKAKDDSARQYKIPIHDVVIPVMGGASAGGMTALLTASTINNPIVPVKVPVAETLMKPHPENKLYNSWVDLLEDDMFPRLLETSDIKSGQVVSLLNSDFIKEVADKMICCDNEKWRDTPKYFEMPLRLFTTLSNLEGFEYDAGFNARKKTHKYLMSVHNDYACFELFDKKKSEPVTKGWMPLNFKNDDNVQTAKNAAMATGAFPIGLRARILERDADDVNENPWLNKEIFGKKPLPKGIVKTLNIDGGMINNEPFDKVRWLLDDKYAKDYNLPFPDNAMTQTLLDKVNCDGHSFENTVLMIDPFPSTQKGKFDFGDNLQNILGKTLGAMVAQMRAKPSDYRTALGSNDVSRYIITPARELRNKSGDIVDEVTGDHAIACGTLGGFGGFLSKEFRIHDYYLGRYNCEVFLRDYFTLPLADIQANPIFRDGYNGLTADEMKRFESGKLKGQYQIIPILAPRPAENYFPIPEFSKGSNWPCVNQADIDRLAPKLRTRIQSVMVNLFNVSWFYQLLIIIGAKAFLNKLISHKVLDTFKDALYSWKLISDYVPGRAKKQRYTKRWLRSIGLMFAIACLMLLHPAFHVANMIAIEFAPDEAAFKTEAAQVSYYLLRNNLGIDYVFLFFYSLVFHYSLQIARGIKPFPKWKYLSLLVWLPALFDIVENLAMMQMAYPGDRDIPHFDLYYYAVRIKWGLVVPCVLIVLTAIGIKVFGCDRK